MGRCRIWLLLLCIALLAAYSTAENPYVYTEQLLPVENQSIPPQLPPFQYVTVRFRPESSDNNFEAYKSQANNSPYTISLDSYPFTPDEAYSGQAQYDPTLKESTDSLPSSVFEENNSALYSTGNPITYQTPNLLPIYQYMQFRYSPLSTDVKNSFKIVVPDLRTDTPDKPIAVVPFKPPKRKPNKVPSTPPASPPRPESPSAPSAPYPAQSAPTMDLSAPYAPSAPYSVPSAPYAAPSAPNAVPSAPYAAPSAPYSAPSAPYVAPSAPYAAPSAPAPYVATLASEPSALYSPPGRASGDGPYAPAYSTYYSDRLGSEGDFRSGIFLGNSAIPKPSFIFTRVRGRGLFDVDGGGPLRLDTSSYSYISPENVPVYMLDVSRTQ